MWGMSGSSAGTCEPPKPLPKPGLLLSDVGCGGVPGVGQEDVPQVPRHPGAGLHSDVLAGDVRAPGGCVVAHAAAERREEVPPTPPLIPGGAK